MFITGIGEKDFLVSSFAWFLTETKYTLAARPGNTYFQCDFFFRTFINIGTLEIQFIH